MNRDLCYVLKQGLTLRSGVFKERVLAPMSRVVAKQPLRTVIRIPYIYNIRNYKGHLGGSVG